MKNSKNVHIISSTLKTIASENLVTEEELLYSKDKPLEDILNEKQENTKSQISPKSE